MKFRRHPRPFYDTFEELLEAERPLRDYAAAINRHFAERERALLAQALGADRLHPVADGAANPGDILT